MTQLVLNRQVASATGESIKTVREMGFELVPDLEEGLEDAADQQLLFLDCPFCRKPVLLSCQGVARLPEYAECLACDTIFDFEQGEIYQAELDEVVARAAETRNQCAVA